MFPKMGKPHDDAPVVSDEDDEERDERVPVAVEVEHAAVAGLIARGAVAGGQRGAGRRQTGGRQ